jgi:ParB family transcriptional regulator, chromosome partitioning protein
MLESIPIPSIFPGPQHRLRRIRNDKVQALVESIREIGLQSPISLRAVPCKDGVPTPHCYQGHTYHLVAGEHRLQACKVLGWKEIPALILEGDEAICRLWEIDENLVRAELTEMERAEHLRERKVWYEELHKQTKHGGDRKSEEWHKSSRQLGDLNGAPSFVEDTAAKTGMSERDVERCVRRAEAIAPEVKEAIHDMPEIADKGVELDALAAVEPEEQKAAVEAVKSGKARNVREATQGAKNRKRQHPAPAASDGEIVRREIAAAVKQCRKKITQRLAAVQVNCDGKAIEVVVTFHQ